MTPVPWMVGATVAFGLVAGTLLGTVSEVLFGMAGPLTAAGTTWVLAARTNRRHPERLKALMIKAFAAKMIVYGAYVVLVLEVLQVRPMPFVISFTGYFIALHGIEAFCLTRLVAGAQSSR